MPPLTRTLWYSCVMYVLSYVTDAEVPQRMRTPSGSLLQDINPLIYLSPDDKNNMEDEVEKILSDDNGRCIHLVVGNEYTFSIFVAA